MASLLDDLDDLGSEGEEENEENEEERDNTAAGSSAAASSSAGAASSSSAAAVDGEGDDMLDDEEHEHDGDGAQGASSSSSASASAAAAAMEQARDAELDGQLDALKGRSGYKAVARLRDTRRYRDHMSRISEAMRVSQVAPVVGHLEEWPDYKLVLASNQVIAGIDEELAALHKHVCEAYAAKFPEMASIIPSPLDYLRVVARIGNETDLTLVELGDLLPSAQVMVITVTGSTTAGKPLPEPALADVLAACTEATALEAAKLDNLRFIESRMESLAPNLSALLGARIAAQLVGIAGGLTPLSRIPSCNVQVLGAKKRSSAVGLARGHASASPHAGLLYDSDLALSAPSSLRRKVVRVLAAKVVLAARIDSFREKGDGAQGADYRAGLVAKIAKWQEPPPGQQKKPLAAPDDKPSKRRGGERRRRYKAKFGQTDVRKEANRMTFAGMSGGVSTDYGDVVMGKDHGMLGTSGSGRLRVERKEQSIVTKKRRVEMGGSSGATGGFASSLAFTPSMGLELANPAAAAERVRKANAEFAGYFSSAGTYTQIRKGT